MNIIYIGVGILLLFFIIFLFVKNSNPKGTYDVVIPDINIQESINKFYESYNSFENLSVMTNNFLGEYLLWLSPNETIDIKDRKNIKNTLYKYHVKLPKITSYTVLDYQVISESKVKITVIHKHRKKIEYKLSYILEKIQGKWFFHHILLLLNGTVQNLSQERGHLFYQVECEKSYNYPLFVIEENHILHTINPNYKFENNDFMYIELYKETQPVINKMYTNIYTVKLLKTTNEDNYDIINLNQDAPNFIFVNLE